MSKALGFRYYTESDQYRITGSLNCYDYAIATGIKSKYGNDINIYSIMANDITAYVRVNESSHIEFFGMNYVANPHIKVTTFGENGDASLKIIEKLLDDNKIVIINTLHHELKFLIYYGTPYDTSNGMPFHFLSIVHHDDKHLYYVEAPFLLNKEYYVHCNNNETVGMVEKNYLMPIFSRYLICKAVDIDFNNLQLFDNHLIQLMRQIVESSNTNVKINDKKYYVGISAIEKLIHACSNDNFECHIEDEAFIFSTQRVFSMRIFMKECLIKFAEQKQFAQEKEIFDVFEPSIETWINIYNIFQKRQFKGQVLLTPDMIPFYEQAIKQEKEIIEFISEILEHSTMKQGLSQTYQR